MKTKRPRYIKNAIIWNCHVGDNGAWVRIQDLNLIEDKFGSHYEPANTGYPRFIIHEAYPYKKWMADYVGKNENLKKDKRFTFDY